MDSYLFDGSLLVEGKLASLLAAWHTDNITRAGLCVEKLSSRVNKLVSSGIDKAARIIYNPWLTNVVQICDPIYLYRSKSHGWRQSLMNFPPNTSFRWTTKTNIRHNHHSVELTLTRMGIPVPDKTNSNFLKQQLLKLRAPQAEGGVIAEGWFKDFTFTKMVADSIEGAENIKHGCMETKSLKLSVRAKKVNSPCKLRYPSFPGWHKFTDFVRLKAKEDQHLRSSSRVTTEDFQLPPSLKRSLSWYYLPHPLPHLLGSPP
jgi:hypothetical protein